MEKLNELLIKFCPAFILACWFDVKDLFGMVLVLLIIDNLVAIWKAYKLKNVKKRWFNYKKLKNTINKFISYGLTLIVAWILEEIMKKDFGLTNFVSGYLAIYEAISIFGHLAVITNNPLFSHIIDWLKEKLNFKKYLNK